MATKTAALGYALPFLTLLSPLTVVAQDTPKIEVFGGYSYLGLTAQSRTSLKAAGLSGWNVSVKLNVTPRIGLVADFSGNYGQRGLTPYTTPCGISIGPCEAQRVEALPADMRQYTFLFGPEVRVLRRNRLSVNLRALVGAAHTSTLVLPLVEPIQSVAPPTTQFSFPSATTFAAALGGSVDFRITDRLSYRIVQPELLYTRPGSPVMGNNWSQYNFRLSTGLVFRSGESTFGQSSGRQFSFGVIGGAALTDAFGYERSGSITGTGGGTEQIGLRSYSTRKDYIIGPMVEIGLPWRSLSVEIDALYRPMSLTMAAVLPNGTLNSVSPATVVTWEFPALAKYRFTSGKLEPFIEAGPSFRVAGNLNDAAPSVYGGTAGLGVEAQVGKLRISPVVRYTHWAADAAFGAQTKRNQVELLVGVSF